MTLTIEFTAEEEAMLLRRANRAGLTPEEYVRMSVDGLKEVKPRADVLVGYADPGLEAAGQLL